MALTCEVGSFVKDSSGTDGATQDVTTGFTPKAIILWGEYSRTVDTGNAAGTASMCTGYSDGTNEVCVGGASEDAPASSDTTSNRSETQVLEWYDEAQVLLCKASVAFGTNKFTITWDENTDTTATKVNYIIYGGADITGVEVGSLNTPTSTGVTSFTVGQKNISDNEGVLFTLTNTFTNFGVADTNHMLSLGAASSATNEASMSVYDRNAVTTTESHQHNTNDSCLNQIYEISGTTTQFLEASFDSWDADGFNLNFTTVQGTSKQFSYMVIKGGQWEVGMSQSKGNPIGTQAYTTAFQPTGLFTFAGEMSVVNTFRSTDDISQIIGASDGTNDKLAGYCSQDAEATSDVEVVNTTAKCVSMYEHSNILRSEASVDSFNATDFTLDWSTTSTTLRYFLWVVCGSAAAAGGFAHSQGCVIG